jgi:hypothetical protein
MGAPMWKRIRVKYLRVLLWSGINGIWGLLMGENDLNMIFWSQKAQIWLSVYVGALVLCILTAIATSVQKRREEYETIRRAHGEPRLE